VPQSHPMMPTASHDEQAEQLFIRDLKIFIGEEVDPFEKQLAERLDPGAGADDDERLRNVRHRLYEHDSYRAWVSLRRSAQEMMWDAVGASVDRQADDLNRRADAIHPKGSLELDPDFVAPAYLRGSDTHLMPGGYHADWGDGSVLQGAMMDRGGAVFMLGRNGGLMNDVRGHTAVSHLFTRYPDMEPRDLLEMGCGVGSSTVAIASYFPGARVCGIDVGASILRYAHARAEHLDAPIHFSQQNAEHTRFPDRSFDVVMSCAMLHETSHRALSNIMAESYRLLRPGGVVIHLEVPLRYEDLDLWGQIVGDFEIRYNNEPFWRGALEADYEAELTRAGFDDIAMGYQAATPRAARGEGEFTSSSQGLFRSWFVASARK
jgi:SAM-dependent methyltransferase